MYVKGNNKSFVVDLSTVTIKQNMDIFLNLKLNFSYSDFIIIISWALLWKTAVS